jgi:Ni,Fe-hydrogenase maturation factor
VKEDSLALKVAKKIKKILPVEIMEFDTAESLESEGKNIVILDVAMGLKRVEAIMDLKKIERDKIFSMHDFDLSYELKLLKKLKMIEQFVIIGIPPQLKEKEILQQASGLLAIALTNPSYL